MALPAVHYQQDNLAVSLDAHSRPGCTPPGNIIGELLLCRSDVHPAITQELRPCPDNILSGIQLLAEALADGYLISCLDTGKSLLCRAMNGNHLSSGRNEAVPLINADYLAILDNVFCTILICFRIAAKEAVVQNRGIGSPLAVDTGQENLLAIDIYLTIILRRSQLQGSIRHEAQGGACIVYGACCLTINAGIAYQHAIQAKITAINCRHPIIRLGNLLHRGPPGRNASPCQCQPYIKPAPVDFQAVGSNHAPAVQPYIFRIIKPLGNIPGKFLFVFFLNVDDQPVRILQLVYLRIQRHLHVHNQLHSIAAVGAQDNVLQHAAPGGRSRLQVRRNAVQSNYQPGIIVFPADKILRQAADIQHNPQLLGTIAIADIGQHRPCRLLLCPICPLGSRRLCRSCGIGCCRFCRRSRRYCLGLPKTQQQCHEYRPKFLHSKTSKFTKKQKRLPQG